MSVTHALGQIWTVGLFAGQIFRTSSGCSGVSGRSRAAVVMEAAEVGLVAVATEAAVVGQVVALARPEMEASGCVSIDAL